MKPDGDKLDYIRLKGNKLEGHTLECNTTERNKPERFNYPHIVTRLIGVCQRDLVEHSSVMFKHYWQY